MYPAPMSCYGLSMQPRPFSLVLVSLALAFSCGVACGDDGRDDPVVCGDEQALFEPCSSDANCDADLICNDGYCTQTCRTVSDCTLSDTSGLMSCDGKKDFEDLGYCSLGCTPDNPCPDDQTGPLLCSSEFEGFGTCRAAVACEEP